MSDLNPVGEPQSFSIRLTDGSGASATWPWATISPALQYPAGLREPSDFFEGDQFTGRAPLEPVRVPLDQFQDVDLGDIRTVGLVFDQSDSGSLFLADAEVVASAVP